MSPFKDNKDQEQSSNYTSDASNPFENSTSSNPFEAKKGRAKSKYKSKATPRYNQRTKSPVENNRNLSSKYQQKKREVIIAIIVICGIVLAANWWQVEDFFEEQVANIYLNSLDPVENYTFNLDDFNGEFESNPFVLQSEPGETITIDQTDPNIVGTGDEYSVKYIVGKDIPAGTYTTTTTGNVFLHFNTLFRMNTDVFGDEDGTVLTNYNIPLVEGDEVTIELTEKDTPFEVTLTPQTEYHMYSPGDAGLFVYGLSNDQTEIEFNEEDYHEIEFCYPDRGKNYGVTCDFNYEENVEIPGLAGSYFSVML